MSILNVAGCINYRLMDPGFSFWNHSGLFLPGIPSIVYKSVIKGEILFPNPVRWLRARPFDIALSFRVYTRRLRST